VRRLLPLLAGAVLLALYPLAPRTPPPAGAQSSPPPAAPAPEPPPGVAAPPEVVQEIHQLVTHALQRFHAMDAPGLLGLVSDRYRTGPLTKRLLRDQLAAIFGVYDTVQATVRIDDVRMVGDHAWIFSTGEVSGRVRWLRTWTTVLWWDRELEIARREGGAWRLFGYQQ
jgi:hypothetical protein